MANRNRTIRVVLRDVFLSFDFDQPRGIRRKIRRMIVFAIEFGFEFTHADQALDIAEYLLRTGIEKNNVIRWLNNPEKGLNRQYSNTIARKRPVRKTGLLNWLKFVLNRLFNKQKANEKSA